MVVFFLTFRFKKPVISTYITWVVPPPSKSHQIQVDPSGNYATEYLDGIGLVKL